MAGGDLGPQEDAERVPCRVGRGRVCFLASGFRSGGVGLWHVVVRIQSWRVGRTVCGDSGNLSDPPARCCVRCCCGMWPSGCHHAPLLMPWFLTLSGGNKAVAFIVFAVAFILACVAALCLPERTGKELED